MTNEQDEAPWDRTAAADQMGDALEARDAVRLRDSAHRLGDAIVNGAMSKYNQTMLDQVGIVVRHELKQQATDRQVKLVLDQIITDAERHYDHLLGEMQARTDKEDARHDAFRRDLREILLAVKDGAARLGRLEQRMD